MDATEVSSPHAYPTSRTLDSFDRLATRSYAQSRPPYVDPNLTFAPKLNAMSIRLARQRLERMEEEKARPDEQNKPHQSQISCRPVMSLRSLRIAAKLSSSFMDRQQQHLEKKQVFLEQTHKLSLQARPLKVKGSPTKCKRNAVSPARGDHVMPPWSLVSGTLCRQTSPESPSAHPQPAASQIHLPRCPSATVITGAGERGGGSLNVSSVSPSVRPSSTLTHCQPERARVGDAKRCLFRSETVRKGGGEEKSKESQRSRHNTSPGTTVGEVGQQKPNPTHQRTCSMPVGASLCKPSTEGRSYSKLKQIQTRAEELMKDHKVFAVRGAYKVIRRGLRGRGWVERDYCVAEDMAARGRGAGRSEGVAEDDDDGNVSPTEESSDEEYSDEEDYCLLVWGGAQRDWFLTRGACAMPALSCPSSPVLYEVPPLPSFGP